MGLRKKNGGARPGAGAKKGMLRSFIPHRDAPFKQGYEKKLVAAGMTPREVRDAKSVLKENGVLIVNKALGMALSTRKPNVPVLLKLMDKVAPNLTATAISGRLDTTPFSSLSSEEKDELAMKYARRWVEKQKAKAAGLKLTDKEKKS